MQGSLSTNAKTQNRITKSEMPSQTDDLPFSLDLAASQLLSFSRSIPKTLSQFPTKVDQTHPFPVSHENLPSDGNGSSPVIVSRPFNHNTPSSQWSSSDKGNPSILIPIQTQSLGGTVTRLSNPFFASLSNLPTNLFATAMFGTLRNPDLKVYVGSVEITSSAVGGASFIALMTIFCVFFLFHRKHNRRQTEKPTGNEFDLSTEHRNEESDVEEHFFDLPNDRADSEYLTGSESWDNSGDDFRIHCE
jgi:hypothetical protein